MLIISPALKQTASPSIQVRRSQLLQLNECSVVASFCSIYLNFNINSFNIAYLFTR